MTDLLAAFIEWLAVLAMSLVGIDYNPAAECDTPPPVEDETVEFLPAGYLRPATYQVSDLRALETGLKDLSNCDTPALIMPTRDMPVLVQRDRVYDS